MQNYDVLFSQVDSLREEIIDLERSMVQIPTVNTGVMPTGNETALCEYVRDWLSRDGITAEIIESLLQSENDSMNSRSVNRCITD